MVRHYFLWIFIFCSSFVGAETLTEKNIVGQKTLFKEGWFIVTSPVEAWDTAIQNNLSSREAFQKTIDKIKLNKNSSSQRASDAKTTIQKLNKSEEKASSGIFDSASKLQRVSFQKSSKNFQEAWNKLSLGYIEYQKNNADDLKALTEINRDFFKRTNSDFKTMNEALESVMGELLIKSEVPWRKHFQEGKYSFQEQYEKSGSRGNSIHGLWDILVGYATWTYHAVLRPGSKSVYNSVKSVPYYTVDGILKTFIATMNVVHSLGANVYYPMKLGYKVISPSLEAGYLSGLALMQAFNGAVTSNALRTAGVINKVAINGTAPLAGGSQFVFEEIGARASDAATILLYGSIASAEVIVEKVETGVVLGYSALSQIPPQLLLTGMNSAIFLVYDGPKLLIAKVSGDIGDQKVEDLPVGSVLDMRKAKDSGLKIETMTDDPEVIQKVLKNVD